MCCGPLFVVAGECRLLFSRPICLQSRLVTHSLLRCTTSKQRMCHESTLETDWSGKKETTLTSNIQQRSTTHYSVADEYCSNADCCRDSSIGNFATTFFIFPLQAYLANSNDYFCSLPTVVNYRIILYTVPNYSFGKSCLYS